MTGKLEVMGYSNPMQLEFWAKNFTLKTLTVYDSFGYQLLDKAKADDFIIKAAAALKSRRLIGSGWRNNLIFDKTKFVVAKKGLM